MLVTIIDHSARTDRHQRHQPRKGVSYEPLYAYITGLVPQAGKYISKEHGLAAIVSSRDLPCFLSTATLFRMVVNMSRDSARVALFPTGPCPGMTIVLSVTTLKFRSVARIIPSILPPVE